MGDVGFSDFTELIAVLVLHPHVLVSPHHVEELVAQGSLRSLLFVEVLQALLLASQVGNELLGGVVFAVLHQAKVAGEQLTVVG